MQRISGLRSNVHVHDAACVALAEALAAPLLARDAKLASSIGHGARIELV